MRVLFALPGLHRYYRGAEIAFISIAKELVRLGNSVTLIGSGQPQSGTPYRFLHASCLPREKFERFPKLPIFRTEFAYEELTFVPSLLRAYQPAEFDVTLTCSYPFTNWALRHPWSKRRPRHVFITQNGDWPAYSSNREYRFFGCDGLVCTNPDFYERNKTRWHCCTIPNGVDCDRFRPGPGKREQFGLPANRPIILMVSALSPSKRVEVGIEAVSLLADAHLVVAGDGPEREAVDEIATRRLPGRFTRLSLSSDQMPSLYQSADVFLHLSKEESFGNVFIEAMACGLPIVAHDSPRSRWIMGENNYLLDSSDVTTIAGGLKLALQASPADQSIRAKNAKKFSWSRIGQLYHDFLTEVAAGTNLR